MPLGRIKFAGEVHVVLRRSDAFKVENTSLPAKTVSKLLKESHSRPFHIDIPGLSDISYSTKPLFVEEFHIPCLH
jgi:hypothetical protein